MGYDIVPFTPRSRGAAASTDTSEEEDHQAASRHYEQIVGLDDMDPEFLPIYEACRRFTMTSAQRMFAVYKAIAYIEQAGIPGDIVECGVWRGGSMMVAMRALLGLNGATRQFHLFDTYEGLPKPDANDVDIWGNEAAGWWQQKRVNDEASDWAMAGLDEVRANLRTTGYPEDRVRLIKGMVEDTIPAEAPAQIALMRLDTDWYASTKHELEHLFSRLAPNGVMIIDDYGHFQGAKKAVDEYLLEHRIPLMLMRVDYTGRIAINTVPQR
jgi:hypothetical protein